MGPVQPQMTAETTAKNAVTHATAALSRAHKNHEENVGKRSLSAKQILESKTNLTNLTGAVDKAKGVLQKATTAKQEAFKKNPNLEKKINQAQQKINQAQQKIIAAQRKIPIIPKTPPKNISQQLQSQGVNLSNKFKKLSEEMVKVNPNTPESKKIQENLNALDDTMTKNMKAQYPTMTDTEIKSALQQNQGQIKKTVEQTHQVAVAAKAMATAEVAAKITAEAKIAAEAKAKIVAAQ